MALAKMAGTHKSAKVVIAPLVFAIAHGAAVHHRLLGEGVTLSATDFGPYPGYTGSLTEVSGSVTQMVTVGTTQTFDFALAGLDPDCASGPSEAGNSCGIHIHAGKSCSDASLVLGHYYTGAVTADPWTDVWYTADSSGAASGTLSVQTGGDAADVAGRALVLHGKDGGRIACALLGEPAMSSPSPPSSPLPSPGSPPFPPPPSPPPPSSPSPRFTC